VIKALGKVLYTANAAAEMRHAKKKEEEENDDDDDDDDVQPRPIWA